MFCIPFTSEKKTLIFLLAFYFFFTSYSRDQEKRMKNQGRISDEYNN